MPQVDELLDDDVVDEAHRRLDDAPVQSDGTAVVAASPALALLGDDDAGCETSAFRPPRLDPLRQPFGAVPSEPGDEGGPHLGSLPSLPSARRCAHVQPAAAQPCRAPLSSGCTLRR